MVNSEVTNARPQELAKQVPAYGGPEQALALGYAPSKARPPLLALFALDSALGQVLGTTREPMIGQMRLTWWHDAICRLDTTVPPAEPVLTALARDVLPQGIPGIRLAELIEGWEDLLEADRLDDTIATLHAARRGGRLFEMAGDLLGAAKSDPLLSAGTGWALADLARHITDRDAAEAATGLAAGYLSAATAVRWSRASRPLGALAHLARMNLRVPLDRALPVGAPRRVGRILLHRITGR